MTNKKQDITGNLYTRGRHNNIAHVFTSLNSLILYNIFKKDLKHIYDDILSNDMC